MTEILPAGAAAPASPTPADNPVLSANRRPRKGAARRAKTYRDTGDVAAATARLVRVVGRRVAEEDPANLAELQVLEAALREAWATAIAGLRANGGASDAMIGEVLGVSKQAVAQRWPRNPS
jgi:hypothetical protein